MTREQIIEVAKPILFSPQMVRAIADDRKTATRRVIKPQPKWVEHDPKRPTVPSGWWWQDRIKGIEDPQRFARLMACVWAKYKPGDFLWVRETWCECATIDSWLTDTALYAYKADYPEQDTPWKWRPSIHMPKAAARLFLRVTGVKAERLREMVLADVLMEGIQEAELYEETWNRWHNIWDSLRKKAELPLYGWRANPWVWVIKFERVNPS